MERPDRDRRKQNKTKGLFKLDSTLFVF